MKRISPIFFIIFLWFCNSQQKQDISLSKTSSLTTVKILNQKKQVFIPVSGNPEPIKSNSLSVADSSLLISLLVEKGDNVKYHDLLGSLWIISKRREYTPKDLISPLAGTITELNYKLNTPIPPYSTILKIEYLKQLKMIVRISKHQLSIVKKFSKVIFKKNGQTLQGYVKGINHRTLELEIIIPNKEMDFTQRDRVSGLIDCGIVEGTYLPNKYFNHSDSLYVKIEDDILIYIHKIALFDSLALISPSLYDKKEIYLFKENLTSINKFLY